MTESPTTDLEPTAPKSQSLLRSSLLMASGTLLSRILGFVKSALLIAAIGVSAGVADSFQLANNLPQTVYNLLAAGMLDAVLIPQIVRALKTRSGQTYVNRLLTLAGLILFLMTVVALIASPLLVIINAGSFTPEMRALAITFSLWCLPQIFFYGLYNLFGELLNARGVFGPYMWAPVANNVVAIAGLVAFIGMWEPSGEVREVATFTTEQIIVLAGSATAGVIVQAAVLFIPMQRSGVKFSLDFHFRGTSFRTASRVAGWTFATLMVSQVGVLSTNNLATRASSWTETTGQVVASLQAYNYGFMVYMVPQSLISLTLATAIFTRMANNVADRQWGKVAENYEQGIRLITMLSFACAAIIIVTAQPIMQIIMPSFEASSSSMYANVLVALIPALASTGIVMMSQRVFYAFEDAKPVFLMGIVPTVLQVIVGWGIYLVAEPQYWAIGAAAAETVCRITQGFIAIFWTARQVPTVNAGRLIVHYLRYFAAFAISAGIGAGLMHFIGPASLQTSSTGRFGDALWKFAVVAAVIAVIYLALLRVLDKSGFSFIRGALLSRFTPGARGKSAGEAEETAEPSDEGEVEAIGFAVEDPPDWDSIMEGEAFGKRIQRAMSATDPTATGEIPLLFAQFDGVGDDFAASPDSGPRSQQGRLGRGKVSDVEGEPPMSPEQQSSDSEESFDPARPMLIFAALVVVIGVIYAVLNLFPFQLFGGSDSSQQSQATVTQTEVQEQSDATTDSQPEETAEPAYVAPAIAGISVASWSDDDGDHPELADNLTDGDDSTLWYSRYYYVNQFSADSMIGLLIELEDQANVSRIILNVTGSGGEVQVRTNPAGDPRQGEVVTTFALIDGETVVELPETLTTDEIALLFVTLPTDDEGMYRAKISEITVE